MTPKRIERTSNPLPYGKIWSSDGFTCESTQAGLTCRRTDGHGFSLSRSAIKQF